MPYENIFKLLNDENVPCHLNEDVTSHSSFKVGGTACLTVYPRKREDLIFVVSVLSKAGIRFEIIGNASNLLFAFDKFDGVLIFTGGISGVTVDDECITASCGTSLTYVAEIAAKNGLSGLEFAYGIPGLVGGAVYMNAGAYGSQISEVLKYTVAYDLRNEKVIKVNEHDFGYRRSVYMDVSDLICLEAVFVLKRGNEAEIRGRMRENMNARIAKQPLEFASAGSYFKRPNGYFAGKLIEECGLKGLRVGGAEVSMKHAGFIINIGDATADDILSLEEKIKERVMSRFGVELEREVRLIK